SHKAWASRGSQTAPGSLEWRSPSGWRGGSSAWSARRDRRNCRPACSFRGLLQRRLPVRFEKLLSQLAQQSQFRLEVDIVRQLEVFDETRRLHIVGMRQHELLVLCRRQHLLTEFAGTKRTFHQRHGHGLAFTLAEGKTVAAGETWRFARRALELVDHLALGQFDRSERHRKADILRKKLGFHLAEADLARKRMVAAITSLRRIAKREQKAFVAAR